jgi:hypothetical protein
MWTDNSVSKKSWYRVLTLRKYKRKKQGKYRAVGFWLFTVLENTKEKIGKIQSSGFLTLYNIRKYKRENRGNTEQWVLTPSSLLLLINTWFDYSMIRLSKISGIFVFGWGPFEMGNGWAL